MSVASSFLTHDLPVFKFLSTASKEALRTYIDSGNPTLRQKRLLEFFKSLDWLPLEEIAVNPIEKLSPDARQRVYQDIQAYFSQKASQREESAERRKAYQLKVFEYYRTHMPASDKALLEGLRDYELDLTGRDVNWQHYFSLKSFKSIDAFIQQPHVERLKQIAAFKADVDAYKRNRERWLHQAACDAEGHLFDFDDWCEWY